MGETRANESAVRRSLLESAIIGVSLAFVSPLLWFVTLWWSAVLAFQLGVPLTQGGIAAAALTGLTIGVVLDVLLLARWVRRFYTLPLAIVFVFYLGLCVVAGTLCMGLPVGTFAVGIAAGIYIGRRECHAGHDATRSKAAIRRASLLTAMVTTGLALPIGIMALHETSILRWLAGHFGLTADDWSGPPGRILVGGLLMCLFGLQFAATRWAGKAACHGWRRR
jgi:hypothetical protein